MCYFSMCVSTHIAKIVIEIKLTIKSNLFKNGCLFIYSIQQKKHIKTYWPIAGIYARKKNSIVFFSSID